MNAIEFANELRRVADFIEAHPELPTPQRLELDVWHCTKQNLADVAKAIGKAKKGASGGALWLRAEIGPSIRIDYNTTRDEVCERVQTGTEIEPEHIIPAQPEQIVPAREVPVYEWRCGSILKPDSETPEVVNA